MPLDRFMEVKRSDEIPFTCLRHAPTDTARFVSGRGGALNREVVEILDRRGPTNGYIHVQLALTQERGWIRQRNLHDCPEGTGEKHLRLAGEDHAEVRIELTKADQRWHEVQQMISSSICSHPKCACKGVDIRIKRLWFVTGQYLGATGLVAGPKETLFHGCKDAVVDSIVAKGFDKRFVSGGAFGKGLYFTPQSCKAFSYAENHLLVCEAALGSEDKRLTLTKADFSLDHDKVCVKQNKRSVQCHAGAPFKHEERIVYKSDQCKPVYIVETTVKSPGGGV